MVKFSDKSQIRMSCYTATHPILGLCLYVVRHDGVWKIQCWWHQYVTKEGIFRSVVVVVVWYGISSR